MYTLFKTSILKNMCSIKILSRNVSLCSTSIHDPVRLCSDLQQTFENWSLRNCDLYFTSEYKFLSAHMCTWMYFYAFVWVYNYSHVCTHMCSLTLLIFCNKDWKTKSSIWLMGICSPAGNAQILDAVKHTTKQTTRKPKTSKNLPTN